MSWLDSLLGHDQPSAKPARTVLSQPSELSDFYPKILAGICVYREARNESREGKEAVWAVIWNRLVSGRWGTNLVSVITAPKQFSCFNPNDLQVSLFPPPTDNRWLECLDVVWNMPPDLIDGAMFYFNPNVVQPVWARAMIKVKSIGAHDFYKEQDHS